MVVMNMAAILRGKTVPACCPKQHGVYEWRTMDEQSEPMRTCLSLPAVDSAQRSIGICYRRGQRQGPEHRFRDRKAEVIVSAANVDV